jgi:hypothetical protein
MNSYTITVNVTFTEDSHTIEYAENTIERFLRSNENVESFYVISITRKDPEK